MIKLSASHHRKGDQQKSVHAWLNRGVSLTTKPSSRAIAEKRGRFLHSLFAVKLICTTRCSPVVSFSETNANSTSKRRLLCCSVICEISIWQFASGKGSAFCLKKKPFGNIQISVLFPSCCSAALLKRSDVISKSGFVRSYITLIFSPNYIY